MPIQAATYHVALCSRVNPGCSCQSNRFISVFTAAWEDKSALHYSQVNHGRCQLPPVWLDWKHDGGIHVDVRLPSLTHISGVFLMLQLWNQAVWHASPFTPPSGCCVLFVSPPLVIMGRGKSLPAQRRAGDCIKLTPNKLSAHIW